MCARDAPSLRKSCATCRSPSARIPTGPRPPAESFRRRFGDCKDKAVLLSALLRRLGFDAAPALVDADGGRLLPDKLPSAGVFDHCIVRLRHASATCWIDATRTHQGTGLATRFGSEFERALVLAAGESGLAEVVRPTEAEGRVEVTDRIDCRKLDSPAEMRSEFVYSGGEAERVRDYFATTDRAKISRRNLDFIQRHHGPGRGGGGAVGGGGRSAAQSLGRPRALPITGFLGSRGEPAEGAFQAHCAHHARRETGNGGTPDAIRGAPAERGPTPDRGAVAGSEVGSLEGSDPAAWARV